MIVNTGDDFEHLGLHISPDIDTVLYTLAGLNDPRARLGPRRRDLELHGRLCAEVGGEAWFQLGDRDLAMHVERTRQLREGRACHAVIAAVARRLGIAAAIVPMSDDPVRRWSTPMRAAAVPALFR